MQIYKMASILILIPMFFMSPVVNAAFDPNITITGSTTFDDSFSFGNTTGQMTNTEAGAATSTALAGSTATGANPLGGTLTDIGDSFSFGGSGNAVDDVFGMGIDNQISVTNNSASVFEVVLELSYRNRVFSAGGDAFADSEFVLSLDGGTTEEFFTDLVSDTLFGNSDGSGFGGELLENGVYVLALLLNPAETAVLDSFWTVDGGDFQNGFAEFESIFTFEVSSVTEQNQTVDAPGALALFSVALFGFSLSRQRKTALI